MKTIKLKLFLFSAFAIIVFSCQEKDDPAPIEHPQVPKLVRVAASQGSVRDFNYNNADNISSMHGTDMFSLDGGMSSSCQATYNALGKMAQLVIDGEEIDSRMMYHYRNGQLIKTEVFANNTLESVHTFLYNNQGQLTTQYSSYQTLTSAEPELKYKYTFEYDVNSNLQLRTQYEKVANNTTWRLYLTSKFEDYDTNFSVKHLTTNFLTPGIKFHQNNPCKAILTNYPGGSASSAIHTYQYNTNRYPVKEITTTVNGNSYETIYTYAD